MRSRSTGAARYPQQPRLQRRFQVRRRLFVERIGRGDHHRLAHAIKRQHAPPLADVPRRRPRQVRVRVITIQRDVSQARAICQQDQRFLRRHDLPLRQVMDERLHRPRRRHRQARRRPARFKIPRRDELPIHKMFEHHLPPVIHLELGRLHRPFLRKARRGRPDHRFRLHRQRREIIRLALDLRHRRHRIRVLRMPLQDHFILQNGRRKLAQLHIRLRDSLRSPHHFLFHPQLQVRFLEDLQRLIVLRLRLRDHLEHFDRLPQLRFFAWI